MKKITIVLAVLFTVLFANLNLSAALTSKAGDPTSVGNEWMKARNGAWAGDMNGKSYWYKLDKDAKLWWSTDKGKNWAHVETQTWSDKDGRWLKVADKNVVWSTDKGITWVTVPDWTWQGSDGKWYKFDKDWTVWVK